MRGQQTHRAKVESDIEVAETIRSFNRFFTEAIGSLDEQHEGLDITLAGSRVLFTIRSLPDAQVGQIADVLHLDLAYTSRVLGTLEDAGLVRRTISRQDRRQRDVALTAKGRRLLSKIERRSNARVLALVDHLSTAELDEVLGAMTTIRTLIAEETAR
jgi:DNA-binding MarR family transcriptional regulator